MTPEQQDAFDLLTKAGLFFEPDEEEGDELAQVLNLNDVWGWASADAEHVPDDQLVPLKNLFFRYGWCGVLYWCVTFGEEHKGDKSEFHDVNRFIEFVQNEERIRELYPESSKRAYHKTSYTIGE